MSTMIFVNLPVADLPRAVAFYEAIGAKVEPRFTDATAACMVISETIHVMLLTHDKFRQFTPNRIAERGVSEVLLCLSADSRAAVDATLARVAGAGGRPDAAPAQEHGFMYGRSFEDPDGHGWEVMWMDLAAFEAAMAGSRVS